MKGSFWRLPFRTACPSTIAIVSPGPATMRLMKFVSALVFVGAGHGWSSLCATPHSFAFSAPLGGWKTVTSPTFGSPKRFPIRLTSTR